MSRWRNNPLKLRNNRLWLRNSLLRSRNNRLPRNNRLKKFLLSKRIRPPGRQLRPSR